MRCARVLDVTRVGAARTLGRVNNPVAIPVEHPRDGGVCPKFGEASMDFRVRQGTINDRPDGRSAGLRGRRRQGAQILVHGIAAKRRAAAGLGRGGWHSSDMQALRESDLGLKDLFLE